MKELQKRKQDKSAPLVNLRRQMGAERPDEDEGKLDLEAGYSEAGMNYAVSDMAYQDYAGRFQDEIVDMQNEDEKLLDPEAKKVEEEADRINSSSNSGSNKYLRTDEGRVHSFGVLGKGLEALKNLFGPKKKQKKKK